MFGLLCVCRPFHRVMLLCPWAYMELAAFDVFVAIDGKEPTAALARANQLPYFCDKGSLSMSLCMFVVQFVNCSRASKVCHCEHDL